MPILSRLLAWMREVEWTFRILLRNPEVDMNMKDQMARRTPIRSNTTVVPECVKGVQKKKRIFSGTRIVMTSLPI